MNYHICDNDGICIAKRETADAATEYAKEESKKGNGETSVWFKGEKLEGWEKGKISYLASFGEFETGENEGTWEDTPDEDCFEDGYEPREGAEIEFAH